MLKFIRSLSRDERGVSALEYAVLAGIVLVAVVAAGTLLQDGTTGLPGMFSKLLTKVSTAIGN